MSRAIVVLPLRPDALEQLRELPARGSPFDPAALGLDGHQVFLTDREAVFVFEAWSQSLLERLVSYGG